MSTDKSNKLTTTIKCSVCNNLIRLSFESSSGNDFDQRNWRCSDCANKSATRPLDPPQSIQIDLTQIQMALSNILSQKLTPLKSIAEDVRGIKMSLDALDSRVKTVEQCTSAIGTLRESIHEISESALQGYGYARMYEDLSPKEASTDEKTIDVSFDKLNYDMSGEKLMVVFHQYKVPGYEPRLGSERDVADLEKVFRDQLGFDFVVHTDYKCSQIWNELTKLRDRDHKKTSCLCIVILTHGSSDGQLQAADRTFPFQSVLAMFENHSTLVSKPRLFFVQACRGPNQDGHECIDNDEDEVIPVNFAIPSHADFFVMHSTVDDYVSVRDLDEGSWFIKELCSVVSEEYSKLDLLKMATLIQKKVAYDYEYLQYSRPLQRYQLLKQIPETTFTLTKHVNFCQ